MENKINRIIRLATIMIFFIFASGFEGVLFPLPYRYLAPFEGKVIDADSKKPLEGAAVLPVYYYTTYTIARANSQIKEGQETVTDQKNF